MHTGRFLLAMAGGLILTACGPGEEAAAPQAVVADSMQAQTTAVAGPAAVDFERLLAADQEPQQWMSVGRTYSEQHYSPLTGINRNNVASLGLAWYVDFNIPRGQESTPLVVDGVIYVTTFFEK